MGNILYYGDNLDVLRDHVADESVDLVYLDPPFNSNARYNVLFADPSGELSEAQAEAFLDTWRWRGEAEHAYDDVMAGGTSAAEILRALRSCLGESDLMAYLSMMTCRLVEMHRVLKPTGSLYLHCDPTASHYLKIILDGLFGAKQFLSEIIWKRSSAHNDGKQGRKQHGRIHDVILYYAKGSEWTWNQLYTEYDQSYVDAFYKYIEAGTGLRYRKGDLTAAKPGGKTKYEWRVKKKSGGEWEADLTDEWKAPKKGWEYKGVRPYSRRIWAYNKERMTELSKKGRLVYAKTGTPNYKRYLDEMPGVPLQDLWTDIHPISSQAKERLGYPTQKPLALMRRIIEASTSPGDIVLDAFCGCGTTIQAAQESGRQWIGIDVTHYAVSLIEARLKAAFPRLEVEVEGRPKDFKGAQDLASRNKYQFQWWANWKIGVQNYREQKKGPDRGIDGTIFFKNGPYGTGRVLVSVKGGDKVGVSAVRDLRGTLERESAELGVLITLNDPTRDMIREAAAAGLERTAHGKLSKIQIVTAKDLVENQLPKLPPAYQLERQTTRERELEEDRQLPLMLGIKGGKAQGKTAVRAGVNILAGERVLFPEQDQTG